MKVALVTGGSGEIGSAVAHALAAQGFDICVGYYSDKNSALTLCHCLADSYNVNSAPVYFNLADLHSIQNSLDDCRKLLGSPSVLVNNGGTASIGLFQDLSSDELVRIINTDMVGTMLLTKLALPDMLHKHSGYIVNISSVWGEVGASCEVAYSAAKAGIIGFTKALAKEVAPSGVIVNCVSPGFIDTKMNGQLTDEEYGDIINSIPCSRAGKTDDVAQAVAFLVSGKADYICGQTIRIDGAWN